MIQGPKETSQRKKHLYLEMLYQKTEKAEVMGEGLGESVESKRYMCVHAKLLQSSLTLCNPMEHTPPVFSVCGILQARILEWVAMSSSRGSSQPRDRTHVSHLPALTGAFFTISATWGAPCCIQRAFPTSSETVHVWVASCSFLLLAVFTLNPCLPRHSLKLLYTDGTSFGGNLSSAPGLSRWR